MYPLNIFDIIKVFINVERTFEFKYDCNSLTNSAFVSFYLKFIISVAFSFSTMLQNSSIHSSQN